jgi:hypothetical protein
MVRGLQDVHRRTAARRWIVAAAAALACTAAARAADVETRDFAISVDGKSAGDAHMTFNRQEDGSTVMSCDTDVKVTRLLITFRYSYRGREVWKDGRLQRFDSKTNDNGKEYSVIATAEATGLRVRVNKDERMVSADVWPTSYWSQPDGKWSDKTVQLLDADTGRDLSAKVQFIGAEEVGPEGQTQTLQHVRLTGKVEVDLWYDDAKRLTRQEWVEDGHRTALALTRIRR